MKITSLVSTLIIAAGITIASTCIATPSTAAFEFDTPNFSYSDGYDWNLGIDFRADQALMVDALAYFDDGPSISSHTVALFSMDGTKLAETTVHPGDTLSGNFRYSNIAPVLLNAGGLYRIIGNSTGDNYTFAVSNFSINSMLTYLGYSYSSANGLGVTFDANATIGSDTENAAWGPNMRVSAAQVSVPEPATYLILILGIAAIIVSRRVKH